MFKKLSKLIFLSIFSIFSICSLNLFCSLQNAHANTSEAPTRTIMIYMCGADLESYDALGTYNLEQVLSANFSSNEKVKVIVMTGGSYDWWFDSSYLFDPANPDDEIAISTQYNQIWEAKGADSEYQEGGMGKLILVDRDGVSGDGENAKPSEQELMTNQETLKKFINFTVQNYPADKYDLILWDHGGGALDGFGIDDHSSASLDDYLDSMDFSELIDALSDNDVIRTKGKFDFINFDACLMNNVELNLALAGLTDYYIASAETEPGFGQEYSGWLNALGENPSIETFELGKIIVDDFVRFYEEGEGAKDAGTLAIVNMQNLMDSNFLSGLNEISTLLRREITQRSIDDSFLYYDELGSSENSFNYADDYMFFRDLGNLVSQLPIRIKEINEDNINPDGTYTIFNDYKISSRKVIRALDNDAIIYSKTTDGFFTKDARAHIDGFGEIQYGPLNSSGMYIFFPALTGMDVTIRYIDEIQKALPFIQNDMVKEFLTNYLNAIINYELLIRSGNTVTSLIDEGTPKDEINFNTLKEYLLNQRLMDGDNMWHYAIEPLINAHEDSEDEVVSWLSDIIIQQKDDAISKDNITVRKIIGRNSNGYRVEIENTDKKIVEGVSMHTVAETPASLTRLIEFVGQNFSPYLSRFGYLVGDIDGVEDTTDLHRDLNDPIDKLLNDYLTWYRIRNSKWNINISNEKVYAVKDQNGNLHAANVKFNNIGQAQVYAQFYVEPTGPYTPFPKKVNLFFESDGSDYTLTKVAIQGEGRTLPVSNLQKDLNDIQTAYPIEYYNMGIQMPLSSTLFNITRDTASDIKLVEANIDELTDIADVDDDGLKLKRQVVIKDMYHHSIDISDKVLEADEDEENFVYNIDVADVENVIYNGQAQGPKLVHNGNELQENVDYTFNFQYDTGECINVGPCEVMLIGKGKYTGWTTVSFEILPNATMPIITLSQNSFIYTGKEITPDLTVTLNDEVLSSDDYTVTFDEGRIDVGTYEVTVALNGNYSSTNSTTFDINPKGTSIKQVKKGGNTLTVKWNRQRTKMSKSFITGYQIELATNSEFTENRKRVSVKGSKKSSRRIYNSKEDETYFARIRTYKTINGKKYFSNWSRVRKTK